MFAFQSFQIARLPDFQVSRNLAWARLKPGLGLGPGLSPWGKVFRCVRRKVRLGSESSSGGAGDVGVWKSRNLEIWKFGDLGTWKSGNWGSNKLKKIKNLKIQIRSAQNVGRVWISRKNNPGPIWCHPRPFFPWTDKI